MTRVFTVPPTDPFLLSLAGAILRGGFPRPGDPPPSPEELADWTVLLPTRRAARLLQDAFLEAGGGRATLLPAIAPLGDLDEEDFGEEEAELPGAVSGLGRKFLLSRLVLDWARANPARPLAHDMIRSPAQTLALAESLARLSDSFETEEVAFEGLTGLFDTLELALHREAIVSLLDIVRVEYPARLAEFGLLGPMERRRRTIERACERLAADPPKGPVVVAGSTGTIKATRKLIAAVAALDRGAAVLPGLDVAMDDASWNAVGPTHPQFAMKTLLGALQVDRAGVLPLPGVEAGDAPRFWLAGELMRPAETVPAWREAALRTDGIARALDGVTLVEAANRMEEAAVIALALREALETPRGTAALITPDRELAALVKSALGRWDIAIDDSAGEPLIATRAGSLLAAAIESALNGFTSPALAALIRHPIVASSAARVFELALLRGKAFGTFEDVAGKLAQARSDVAADRHAHLALRRLSDEQWSAASIFAETLQSNLTALTDRPDGPALDHVAAALNAFAALRGDAPVPVELEDLIDGIAAESGHLPDGPFALAARAILDALRAAPVRPPRDRHPRLRILGLLEARLVPLDFAVLGGLNETGWPAVPDSGPWLNRPMRAELSLQAPERDIGLTAHDFVQAFGTARVAVTWSRRIGDDPAVPSRWVLRLQALLKAAGIAADNGSRWLAWVRALDRPAQTSPAPMPEPRPPIAARPRRLSVTRVETLIDDPYAIYAGEILKLTPLDPLGAGIDYALLGQLVHAALAIYHRDHPKVLPSDPAAALVAAGRAVFAPLMGDPGIASFAWPRFMRIAEWFAGQDAALRADASEVASECGGSIRFDVAGSDFTLTARADRIDLLKDGTARIIDFKTGTVPPDSHVEAGWSPQLTLEAAMVAEGGFAAAGSRRTSALRYIKLSGGIQAGEIKSLPKLDVMGAATRHLAEVKTLLETYADAATPYLPRIGEDDPNEAERDYDHLSRWREWRLGARRP